VPAEGVRPAAERDVRHARPAAPRSGDDRTQVPGRAGHPIRTHARAARRQMRGDRTKPTSLAPRCRRRREADPRVEVDARGERMQAKIRDAQLQKVPYMLVVGDQEAEAGAVAVRERSGENRGALSLAEFLQHAAERLAKFE
jgi:threonyl-tRNA synthetase